MLTPGQYTIANQTRQLGDRENTGTVLKRTRSEGDDKHVNEEINLKKIKDLENKTDKSDICQFNQCGRSILG